MSMRELDRGGPTEPQIVQEDASVWTRAAVRVARALLALYLLPVIALVLAVGGLAVVVQWVARGFVGPSATVRQPIRYRHAPHLGPPVARTWSRTAR